jgi:hypothetical protein
MRRCAIRAAVVVLAFTTFVVGRSAAVVTGWADEPEVAGNKRTPAEQAELDKEFQAFMSGATLKGFYTGVRAGAIAGQAPDEYQLGEVKKVDGKWIFEYSDAAGNTHKLPPISVSWVDGMPLITLSDIKLKGMPGKFAAKILIDDDQYAGTWNDGQSGGHMFGTIVHLRAKKAKIGKPADPKEE